MWIIEVGRDDEVSCPDGAHILDATGLLLGPGFIELQLNGAFGHDFNADPPSVWEVAPRLPRFGVTAFLPTVVTSPPERVKAAQDAMVSSASPNAAGAVPLGLHLEGPFLNPEKKGAHDPGYLRMPDLASVEDWSLANGVRLVTLSPELPGALDLVKSLADRGVVVSAGHSAATYVQAMSGIEAGIRYGTHLFNAMAPLHQREPGVAVALLTDPRIVTGLICDGFHTHPAMVRLAWQALGGRRLNLVSDAIAALGMPPGDYTVGENRIVVDESCARLPDGTIAGAIVGLDGSLRNLVAFAGCSLQEALPTITSTPASVLGLAAERGTIAPGRLADLVLLTRDLHVHTTMVGGRIVYRVRETGYAQELEVGTVPAC
jgi:N-acetylglucosamine-6-phosphate deacetylase